MKKATDIPVEQYAEVYELAKAGMSDKDIAEHLKTRKGTFRRMKERIPALNALVEAGRKQAVHTGSAGHGDDLENYVYGHLPPKVQEHWDRIMKVWRSDLKGKKRRVALQEALAPTAQASKNVRQGLFVHAMLRTGFNGTKACIMSGVPYRTYQAWLKYDPHFQHLLDEVDWHRVNFFKNAFHRLVKKGVPSAVIHAVKSQVPGYGTKLQIETHRTNEDKVSLEDLDLDPKVMKELLKAVRSRKQEALPAHDPNTIEAEVVSVKPAAKKPRV